MTAPREEHILRLAETLKALLGNKELHVEEPQADPHTSRTAYNSSTIAYCCTHPT